MVRCTLIALVASCQLTSGAVPQSDAGVDASIDAPLPPELPAFGPRTLIPELSADMSGDDDPTLSSNRELVIFNSNRDGNPDLYVSTRDDPGAAWEPPAPIAELNTAENESTVALSDDGLALLLASNRINGDQDVFLSTRPLLTAMWSPPTPIDELNSTAGDFASYLSEDRLTVILHSDRAAGDFDLYIATRDSETEPFSTPVPIAGVNAVGFDDNSGRLAAGGRVLTFHSNRGGNNDLYVATRATADDPFGEPVPIDDLNTAEREQDLWLSEDLCYAMFAAVDADGEESFYEATCQ